MLREDRGGPRKTSMDSTTCQANDEIPIPQKATVGGGRVQHRGFTGPNNSFRAE
jgi:hypothetical protein